MPLVVNGFELRDPLPDAHTFLNTYQSVRDEALMLCTQPVKIVGPIGLLYVNQREWAATTPHDKKVTILGTDDATTCQILILRDTASGAVCMAHIDGCGVEEAVFNICCRIQELSSSQMDVRYELHIVGGFCDAGGYSEQLIMSLLNAFQKQHIHVHLVTLCVCELNDILRGNIHWPIIYGIGINVKTGEIFPASFPDRGPDIALRSARLFAGTHQVLDIYDCAMNLLKVGPFTYDPMRGVDLWLSQGDDFIRQHLSTSPEVEPPHFAAQVRASLKHIQQHPYPDVTIFPDNKARLYRKDDSGQWIRIRSHYVLAMR
ncbi:PREDICTED: protein N-terminal asparagine amidohydrolase-like, partial [Priapulus caudatus]|uniref:Protein N-terminal asparagine amidohydrolase-like n=1 Tax=Priapulus caudatus TaxID=37621 RepID=A0ABM1E2Q7_PRICU